MNYNPNMSISKMTAMNFSWGVIGVIIGLIVNQLYIKIFKILNITNKLYNIIIQIFICSLVLSYIHVQTNNYFGWSWQNITPGIFFGSFFFGVQYNIFNNINLLFPNLLIQ
jgi:hypothetical protein